MSRHDRVRCAKLPFWKVDFGGGQTGRAQRSDNVKERVQTPRGSRFVPLFRLSSDNHAAWRDCELRIVRFAHTSLTMARVPGRYGRGKASNALSQRRREPWARMWRPISRAQQDE
jgi:hypothetical protein